MSDRYIVVSVTGWRINPGAGRDANHGKPGTSYSVLDTVDCYREVGKFYVKSSERSYLLKRKAEALCAELNQLDREHEEQYA